MNLKDMSNEEFINQVIMSGDCDCDDCVENRAELLSRLEAGEKAIAAMEQIDTLWQSNLTQDEFDKQLAVVILLKYKEASNEKRT